MGEPRPPAGRLVRIAESLDVFVARWAAQQVAASLGFGNGACQELAIVVSELATNIVKYGVRGTIAVQGLIDPRHGAGIELVAEDEGPPIADLAMAMQDGCGAAGPIDPATQWRRGGIGAGLGAVLRLTDRFEYEVIAAAHGSAVTKRFRCVRYLVRPRRATTVF
jgi:anti-sigma regulatory factor (Ser/Thr protein kinase)